MICSGDNDVGDDDDDIADDNDDTKNGYEVSWDHVSMTYMYNVYLDLMLWKIASLTHDS